MPPLPSRIGQEIGERRWFASQGGVPGFDAERQGEAPIPFLQPEHRRLRVLAQMQTGKPDLYARGDGAFAGAIETPPQGSKEQRRGFLRGGVIAIRFGKKPDVMVQHQAAKGQRLRAARQSPPRLA